MKLPGSQKVALVVLGLSHNSLELSACMRELLDK